MVGLAALPAAAAIRRLPGAHPPVARMCGIPASRPQGRSDEETIMSLTTILLIILVLMLIGAMPTWPHSQGWGYFPSGALGIVVLILLVMLLTGRL